MGKKKHAEHVNHERWLVSYADFITLLFAFFVVLFASSQSDKKKEKQLAMAMQSAFSESRIFNAHSPTPALTDGSGAGENVSVTPVELPLPSSASILEGGSGDDITRKVREAIEKNTAPQIASGAITVHQSADGLTVSLQEGGFFASGSAEVRPEAMPALQRILATLPVTQSIRVEGHSDNQPIHTAQFASNWELSSARASSIARAILMQTHIDPARLAAAGYAEFHPVADNSTEAGRAANRRVDIIVLAPRS